MSNIFSRRDVIKQGAVVVGGLSVLGLVACKDKKAASPKTEAAPAANPAASNGSDPLISLDHPTAKSLKYVHDGSTVDARPEKSGVAGSSQSCNNCNFYKQIEGAEHGTCMLIPVPGKHVAKNGWCVTWAKKA